MRRQIDEQDFEKKKNNEEKPKYPNPQIEI